MKKLLKPKDILLFTLAGVGDLFEEAKDPLHLMSLAYKSMYGFIPQKYKKHNFVLTINRSVKTGDIQKIIKNGKVYLHLTSAGRNKMARDFPIARLTKKWNKRWIVVIFDIEEKSRVVRDRLRNKLQQVGFGMLQESVWISPLAIGADFREFIESVGLEEHVFVMEVSDLVAGDSKDLAAKIWKLDEKEQEFLTLKKEIDLVNHLISSNNDRGEQREAKLSPTIKSQATLYRLQHKKRALMRQYLEFIVALPALPLELLPKSMRKIKVFL